MTINTYLNKTLLSMEIGAIYCEFSNGVRIAFHSSLTYSSITHKIDYTSHYMQLINTNKRTSSLIKFLFKTVDGWCDLLVMTEHNHPDLITYVETYGKNHLVSPNIIKAVNYTAQNGLVSYILSRDGYIGELRVKEDFDLMNIDKFIITQFSITDPGLPFERRALMDDIKITAVDTSFDWTNCLFWVAGIAVEYTVDPIRKHVIYIEKGLSLLNTIPQGYKDVSSIDERPNGGITVHGTQQYMYDFNEIKVFRWKNVSVSNMLLPNRTTKSTVQHYDKVTTAMNGVRFNLELYYTEEIEDAHFIFHNGVVLDPSMYEVSPSNKRKLTLTFLPQHISKLIAYYTRFHDKPYETIEKYLEQSTFALVNFKNTDGLRKLYIHDDVNGFINYPYPDQITYNHIGLGDLILISGMYVPYLWVHDKTIQYPKTTGYTESKDLVNHTIRKISFFT